VIVVQDNPSIPKLIFERSGDELDKLPDFLFWFARSPKTFSHKSDLVVPSGRKGFRQSKNQRSNIGRG
jgi:hypothetical protein